MMADPVAEAWDTVHAAVATARAEVRAAAPDKATAADGEAYVARILTTCLTDAFLGHLTVEGGLTRALLTRGGPNPDYRIYSAPIDQAGRYRLEGRLNGSERVGIGTYSFANGVAVISNYTAFDAGTGDGFALDVSADVEGPNTLTILPGARMFTIRVLHRDPRAEPARLVLTGGPPVRDLCLAQGSTEAALGQVAQALVGSIRMFLEWSAVTSMSKNAFIAEEPKMAQGVQGDPDTIYYLGAYDLADGEWLEVVLPPNISGYWSLHAYDHWCEHLPGASMGDNAAIADGDGTIRIAIGPSTGTATPNCIDTLGRKSGALIIRAISTGSVPVPQTTVHAGET
ncbi:MAG: DUF1254 domain-containing protein [Sphingomicrobium sp.]